MTKKRKRRRPEQIVKLLQEGEAMLAAGKTLAEVYQKLEITESTKLSWFGASTGAVSKLYGCSTNPRCRARISDTTRSARPQFRSPMRQSDWSNRKSYRVEA